MTPRSRQDVTTASDTFKALGDPIRLGIIRQVAEAGELAWGALEDTLPVSKPTISYHIKTLVQAELLSVRKDGRNFYYTIRHDTLGNLLNEIWELSPPPRAARGDQDEPAPDARSRRRGAGSARTTANDGSGDGDGDGGVILTW